MNSKNKKNIIMEVAYDLFIKKGYEHTSVDEIIASVGIAKGTFYYYFKTKEELLEEVIHMILKQEEENARMVLQSPMPVEEKLVGVIAAMQPTSHEQNIANELNKIENVMMHNKINAKINDILTPILSKVIEEGIQNNIFSCNYIEERVKLLLVLSSQLFDEANYTKESILVFIDTVEKILGAKPGTMSFITKLIK